MLRTVARCLVALTLVALADRAVGQNVPRRDPSKPQGRSTSSQPDAAAPSEDDAATAPSAVDRAYRDEPPLDYYERQWRYFTQHATPQRFADRDVRRQYGYSPPFAGAYYPRGGFFGPYGSSSYGFWGYDDYDAGQAYIQGRYDERRFAQWKDRFDRGETAYSNAMDEGVQAFREGDYPNAATAFTRAAVLNQGDPSCRLLQTYALVAIGNYDEAAVVLYDALKLQSRLYYLTLDIRAEYGPKIDFDAHYQRLREAVQASEDDPDLLTLAAFYAYFSGERPAALAWLDRAVELAPRDRVIGEFHRAVQTLTPRRQVAPPPPPAPMMTPVAPRKP